MSAINALVLLVSTTAAGTEPTVLFFYADWCQPCRTMDGMVQGLVADGWPIRRVDIDRERDVVQRFGVQRIPCCVSIVAGKPTAMYTGSMTREQLISLCAGAQLRSIGQQSPTLLVTEANPPSASSRYAPLLAERDRQQPTSVSSAIQWGSWPKGQDRPPRPGSRALGWPSQDHRVRLQTRGAKWPVLKSAPRPKNRHDRSQAATHPAGGASGWVCPCRPGGRNGRFWGGKRLPEVLSHRAAVDVQVPRDPPRGPS